MTRISTPAVPPLWKSPDPPKVNTTAPVDPWWGHPLPGGEPFRQRPPLDPTPLPTRPANSRHPLTGAPTWRPELGDDPLPPSTSTGEQHPPANARSPITGALLVMRGPVPKDWQL